MNTQNIRLHIGNCRGRIDGDFTSAARVVDALLDLRLLAADSPLLIETVDASLREVPGWFVARNDWWVSQLDLIELALTSDVSDGHPEAVEPARQ